MTPSQTIPIYNDNNACVAWSNSFTTKGLRYIQICKNAVRELIQDKTINVLFVEGKKNLADLFTKEMKDAGNFIRIQDLIMTHPNQFRGVQKDIVQSSD